jgi:uncharacterized membrane protein YgaE (UPF0421/DUF939 family)
MEQPRRRGPLGPAGRVLARLGAYAPGLRAVKTALAVGVAWWLANLLGEERPLFAALGALVGMEATVAGSLRRIGLQLVGMLGGLGLAFVVGRLLGASAIGIGLAVLVGLWLGRRVGSADRVGVELGVTTLVLVVFAANDPTFAVERIWETVLGGLIAALINALVLPPDYLGLVADDLHTLVAATARGLREGVRIFVERPRHEGAAETLERLRAVRDQLPDLEARLTLAGSALRLSPLLRRRGPVLERYRVAVQLYGRAIQHVTTLARAVQQHAERDHPWPHAGLVAPSHLVRAAEALSLALERYEAYLPIGEPALLLEVQRELDRAREILAEFLLVAERERASDSPVQRLVDIAAVASELEHLAADLAHALVGLLPYPESAMASSPGD